MKSWRGAAEMTSDPSAGPGGAPDAVRVDPSAGDAVPTDAGDGKSVVPLGVPVDADELRELKRRADHPDTSHADDVATDDSAPTPES
jgi:hypothetical protein